MKMLSRILVYMGAVAVSIALIYFGNQFINQQNVPQGVVYGRETELDALVWAQVVSVDEVMQNSANFPGKEIHFTARKFGMQGMENTELQCQQYLDENRNEVSISKGDRVVLLTYDENCYMFQYYFRFDKVCVLGLVIALFVLAMGGVKGFHTLLSLTLTCLALFFVYVPAIKAGWSIYACTIAICIYIIAMMLLIVYGISKKSIITALSCSSGVIVSGLLSFFVDRWMKLTGYYNEDMFRLNELLGFPVDVKALVFAMITIGALGAIMDVSMSVTSPLCEMKENDANISTKTLLKSGFHIGRDFMGTMTNTLILAYIGSSLVVVLIYAASNYTVMSLLNKEEIIIEFLQSMVGCLGILFTIPFTTIIAAWMLADKNCRR